MFVTGLLSYGFQFELERGQFNVIAASLAYLAVWIYHSGRGSELWAYVLFSLSVQMKLYPLVFIVMFIRDWRDWKSNLSRLSLLALANFGLFFVLGWRVFLDFVSAVRLVSVRMDAISISNHSIHSFITQAAGIVATSGPPWSALHAVYWRSSYSHFSRVPGIDCRENVARGQHGPEC